ncbi:hypothetical protein Dimus_010104 [Dionaea muscipula]
MNNQYKENQQEIDIIINQSHQTVCSNTRDKGKWLDYTNRGLGHGRETHHHRTQEQNPREQPLTSERHRQDRRKEKHDSGIRQDPYQGRNTINNHKENKLCEERNQERREIEERGEKTRKPRIAFGRLSGEGEE